ncbi:hypothetical protein FOZ63_000058, partial [Perkinsus olseni]
FKPNRAPFWPREMSAYMEQYQPLPLQGAVINRELAKTFRPASSPANGPSPQQKGRSRYSDDYVMYPGARKEAMLRPAVQTHVDGELYLLYKQPASHEFYPDWQRNSGGIECVGERCKPPIPKPTTSTMGFHFDARTRYSEDYPPGSGADSAIAMDARESCRVLLEHGSYAEDNSSRVQGNAVPNRNTLYGEDIARRGETSATERSEGFDQQWTSAARECLRWYRNRAPKYYLTGAGMPDGNTRPGGGDAPEDEPQKASVRGGSLLPIGDSRVLEESSSARDDTLLQRELMDCAMGVVKAREAERGARVVVEGLEGRWTELLAGCSSMELSVCVAPPPVGDLCGTLSLGGRNLALCEVEETDATEGRCWVVVLGTEGQRVWVEASDLCLLPGAIKAAARALLRDMDEASAELSERMAGTKEAMDRAASAQEGLIAALEEESRQEQGEDGRSSVEENCVAPPERMRESIGYQPYWHPSLPPLPPSIPVEPDLEFEGEKQRAGDESDDAEVEKEVASSIGYPSVHPGEARHVLGMSLGKAAPTTEVESGSLKPGDGSSDVPAGMPDLGLLKSWGTGKREGERE